ncbi:MAG: hypothetical protein IJ203_10610 [Atopobiaceae bacterium]|nr:hypothetical protein [Atopobiaceae bacterium]
MRYLGIDVGGSSIKWAVMDEGYQISEQGTRGRPRGLLGCDLRALRGGRAP